MHWGSLIVGILIGWLLLPAVMRMLGGGARSATG